MVAIGYMTDTGKVYVCKQPRVGTYTNYSSTQNGLITAVNSVIEYIYISKTNVIVNFIV